MFSENQTKSLNSPLDSSRIKRRDKANVSLPYLEGFDIIQKANEIFGFGNWSYNIDSLTQVSQETNQKGNLVVCYKALVKVVVYNGDHSIHVSREDVGFGTGISKSVADAHEGGAKESVTDALKRTLRTFGNQFGNSLYNKSINHYNQQSNQPPNSIEHQRPNNNPNSYEQIEYQNGYNNQPPSVSQQSNSNTNQSSQTDYTTLFNLGLQIVDQGTNLVVFGDDIFSKKDAIKSCGFMWDGSMKLWYKPKDGKVA
jgi:DNA repair and recombination protein RAD52